MTRRFANGLDRHTLYYRLLDFSFVVQVLVIIRLMTESYLGHRIIEGPPRMVATTLQLASLLIPAFLIFARFMRDDLSEALWQKSAVTVLKSLIILPFPLGVGIAVWIELDPTFTSNAVKKAIAGGAVQSLSRGVLFTMASIWFWTPFLFTFAFQWHRWRASR